MNIIIGLVVTSLVIAAGYVIGKRLFGRTVDVDPNGGRSRVDNANSSSVPVANPNKFAVDRTMASAAISRPSSLKGVERNIIYKVVEKKDPHCEYPADVHYMNNSKLAQYLYFLNVIGDGNCGPTSLMVVLFSAGPEVRRNVLNKIDILRKNLDQKINNLPETAHPSFKNKQRLENGLRLLQTLFTKNNYADFRRGMNTTENINDVFLAFRFLAFSSEYNPQYPEGKTEFVNDSGYRNKTHPKIEDGEKNFLSANSLHCALASFGISADVIGLQMGELTVEEKVPYYEVPQEPEFRLPSQLKKIGNFILVIQDNHVELLSGRNIEEAPPVVPAVYQPASSTGQGVPVSSNLPTLETLKGKDDPTWNDAFNQLKAALKSNDNTQIARARAILKEMYLDFGRLGSNSVVPPNIQEDIKGLLLAKYPRVNDPNGLDLKGRANLFDRL